MSNFFNIGVIPLAKFFNGYLVVIKLQLSLEFIEVPRLLFLAFGASHYDFFSNAAKT
jgi:hypothetical protein